MAEEGQDAQPIPIEILRQMIGGEMLNEETAKKFTPEEAEVATFVRTRLWSDLRRFGLPMRLIRDADGVSDKELLEATQISKGANMLVKPEIKATINGATLKGAVDYWRRILDSSNDMDENMFSAGGRAPVQEWLADARRTLGRMSPKARDTVYLACALKGKSQSMEGLTKTSMPYEVPPTVFPKSISASLFMSYTSQPHGSK
jgi:hypothetical protein